MYNPKNCFLANCNHCARGTMVTTALLGNKRFICKPHKKKHKLMTAETCKHFKCAYSDLRLNCATCTAKSN